MSNIQEILKALAVALHDGLIGEEGCEDLAKALNGVPIEHHMNAFRALLGIDPTNEDAFEKPAETPEDYLAVKTYTSSEFHVGDEVKSIYSGERAIILKNSEGGKNSRFYAVFSDGSAGVKEKCDWHRTGRYFPAIPVILKELKKG